jgi:hypothetical protein
MTVHANQQDVEIPIMISNDVELRGLVIPLTMESTSGGASITSARIEYRDRLTTHLTEIQICNHYAQEDGTCKSGGPGGYGTIKGNTCGFDYPVVAMPEGFLLSSNKILGSNLPPGNDIAAVLVVDVGPDEGTMMIDTTCANPANHLLFVHAMGYPVGDLSFRRGLITVNPCCRTMTGNVDNDPDDIIDIGDLTALIQYLYIPPNPVPDCLEEANIDGDGLGTIDIGDLTALIQYLYIPPNPEPAACL